MENTKHILLGSILIGYGGTVRRLIPLPRRFLTSYTFILFAEYNCSFFHISLFSH